VDCIFCTATHKDCQHGAWLGGARFPFLCAKNA
jgi:hypothetical protein